jgi:hypothetical protein
MNTKDYKHRWSFKQWQEENLRPDSHQQNIQTKKRRKTVNKLENKLMI